MGLNFYDYDGLQPKITPPKHFSRQCRITHFNMRHPVLLFFITARHLPFRVGVDFDNNERAPSAATTMAQLHEQQGSPAGIVGFKLTYFQVTC